MESSLPSKYTVKLIFYFFVYTLPHVFRIIYLCVPGSLIAIGAHCTAVR